MKKEKITIKRWGVWTQKTKGNKSKFVGFRPMRRTDVKNYFKSVASVGKKMGRHRGEWCDRCGVLIGGKYVAWLKDHFGNERSVPYTPLNRKHKVLSGFYLCKDCYEFKKKTGVEEATPDLEDLSRYNIKLNKLNGEYKEDKIKNKKAEQKNSYKNSKKSKKRKSKSVARV